jgi:uncharacterized CHY-type Zn-finger protein
MNQTETKTIICDACRKEVAPGEIKYLLLRTCCSAQRLPLCHECYEKSTGRKSNNSIKGGLS